jgi:hypothetical protein
MATPDFVTVGHAVQDLGPDGWTLGGTVTFAAWQAHRLGLTVGVVTRAGLDMDVAGLMPFAEVAQLPSGATTQFENVYEAGHRRQKVRAQGEPIQVEDVPHEWLRAPIVLVGPVLGEMSADLCAAFDQGSLVGVSVQGWLRALDGDGNVMRRAWDGPAFWRGARALFVSDEDLADDPGQLDGWTRDVPIVAMTKARLGAEVWAGGGWRSMDAFPADEVDPTGAGDTFATAFLIRFRETGDVAEAARFGAAAASISVGGIGVAATPERAAIEQRMAEYPEVALR